MVEKRVEYEVNSMESFKKGMEMIKSGALCQVARSDLRVKLDKLDKNHSFGRKN